MKTYVQIILAFLTGILVCVSFPTLIAGIHLPEMGPLAWVALVPLVLAVRGATARRAFVLTFAAGLIWYAGSIFWVYRAMHTFGHLPAVTSFLVLVLLVIIVAAYIALAPFFARLIQTRWSGELIVWLPVSWVGVEIMRNYVPCNGFPWSNLAMSQWRMLPVIQIADLTGIYGIIFLIVWVNVFVAELVAKLRGERINFFLPKCIMTAVLVASMLCYGFYRLRTIPASIASSPTLSVGMIQGNISQDEKWEKENALANLNAHREKARRLAEAGVEMIIWPEASFPWEIKADLMKIDSLALGFGKGEMGELPYTLFGAISEKENGDYYNSAFLFNASGDVKGRYDKAHLVPFGEYVPYKKIFFFAKKLTQPVGNFVAGESSQPLIAGQSKAGILICYEDVFPEVARREVLSGANFLANLTNDAWYGVSSAPYQHLALSVFRAVENRRFLLRATNTGVSAVVMPTGKVTVESGLFEPALIVSPILLIEGLTPYTRFGDWFALGALAYMMLGIIYVLVKRFKKKS